MGEFEERGETEGEGERWGIAVVGFVDWTSSVCFCEVS